MVGNVKFTGIFTLQHKSSDKCRWAFWNHSGLSTQVVGLCLHSLPPLGILRDKIWEDLLGYPAWQSKSSTILSTFQP